MENLSFKVMDVHDIGFPDDMFDLVVSYTVAHFWLDPAKAMRELKRVTKDGGQIVTAGLRDFGSAPRYPECPNWETVWRAWSRHYEAKRSAFLERGEKSKRFFWDLYAGRKCVEWYSKAGIKDVMLTLKVEDWLYPTSEDMASEAADFLNLDEKIEWGAIEEAVDEGFLEQAVVEKARVETKAWKANPYAFHYHPVFMAVGRV